MSIKAVVISQDEASVHQNLRNKGYLDTSPTTGCSYVVDPPKDYRELFQDLQQTLRQANLPFADVLIPHATVISAKVIDQNPKENWEDLEAVQRVYRSFLLYHIAAEMRKNRGEYLEVLKRVIWAREDTLAAIAEMKNEEDALNVVGDEAVREALMKTPDSDHEYDAIKQASLEALREISFQLSIKKILVTDNGSILFQFSRNPMLADMRLHLIVAGEGIAKWSRLSQMADAWSTVAYTTKVLDSKEEAHLAKVLGKWAADNQEKLKKAKVHFDVSHLGAIAFRSNDFQITKKVVFPLAKESLKVDTDFELSEADLALTPHAGRDGITPTAGNRQKPTPMQIPTKPSSKGKGIWAFFVGIGSAIANAFSKKE